MVIEWKLVVNIKFLFVMIHIESLRGNQDKEQKFTKLQDKIYKYNCLFYHV